MFVDTAVLMYGAGKPHPLRHPSQLLLERIADGELEAVTSAEVVQEILHRFLPGPRRVDGVALARATLDLFAPVLPMTHEISSAACRLAAAYPNLSSRDLAHAATCSVHEIDVIVSPDVGFDTVEGLERVDPTEADAL